MNPLGEISKRLPPTPSAKTTLCTLGISALAASVARLTLLMSGAQPQTVDWLAIPGAFLAGVLILHVGHCAERPTS